jgi:glycosyltransferase involved in cell wall biosynthesis
MHRDPESNGADEMSEIDPPMRRRLLIVGPLPPPFAGPEIGTLMLTQSAELRTAFDVRSLNTTARLSNADKGNIDLTMFTAYIRYVTRLLCQLIGFRPDLLLYCPTSATLIGWVRDGTTLVLGPIFGARVIIQFRGGHFRYFIDRLSALPRRLVGWALSRSSLILAQADVLKWQFRGLVPDNRIGRLYNAIPLEFFTHFEHIDRAGPRPELTVLYVGHLSQAKGYCDLLKVIPDLCRKHRIRFRFMGALMRVERNVFYNQATGEKLATQDPVEAFRQHIEDNGLTDQVELLGAGVFGDEKLRVFESADIFVLPSYSEGFSRAILECMAAGLPAVVTSVGAVPEIMSDGVTSFVIRPGDTQSLFERIDRLAADPSLRTTIGRAARERCRQLFLPESLARSLIGQLTTLP